MNEKMMAIFDEIREASAEIPFENSEFQNLNFVLGTEITPERAYRHCLLRLRTKTNALKECYYSLQLDDIDIEEMQEKIDNKKTNKYEKRRLAIKIEQKKVNRSDTEKLVNDCIVEINTLYTAFKKLPKFTRAEFEAGERQHWALKLTKDFMLKDGTTQSLETMGAMGFLEKVIKSKGKILWKTIEQTRKNRLSIGGDTNVDNI